MTFVMAKYDLYGNFISWDPLTTQLMLCTQALQNSTDFRWFGITVQTSCSFNLTELIGTNPPSTTNMFYELFIQDVDGTLIDVPVVIKNLVSGGNAALNAGDDITQYVPTWRFFIFDTLSGIGTDTSSNATNTTSSSTSMIWWVSSATLFVELDKHVKE